LSDGSKQHRENHNPYRDSKDSSLEHLYRALSPEQTALLRTMYQITLQIKNFLFTQCHKYIKLYTFSANNFPHNNLLYKNPICLRFLVIPTANKGCHNFKEHIFSFERVCCISKILFQRYFLSSARCV